MTSSDVSPIGDGRRSRRDMGRKLVVHTLVILFGISAWVSVNGIWVELPILVQKLPEGWNLPSYLTLIIQLANVGPIAYGLLHQFYPRRVNETSATFVMMTVGTLACLALIFFWNRTTTFGEPPASVTRHSVHLLALVFFVALVDCTSSVVFLPFMRFFREAYTMSLFIGEGFGGLLSGLVALAQGVGDNPTCVNVTTNNETTDTKTVASDPAFGVESFFGFLTAFMSISFAAFVLLRYLPALESERVKRPITENGYSPEHATIITGRRASSNYGTDNGPSLVCEPPTNEMTMSTSAFACLMTLQTLICLLSNGVLSSISSYTGIPYGNGPYHLAVSLSSVANPLACFVGAFLTVRSVVPLSALTVLASLFAVYLIVLASMSPIPPLVGTRIGEILMVMSSICFTATCSFTKASLGSALRERGGARALFWCGVAAQVGSAVGSLVMFVVVNYLKVFHS